MVSFGLVVAHIIDFQTHLCEKSSGFFLCYLHQVHGFEQWCSTRHKLFLLSAKQSLGKYAQEESKVTELFGKPGGKSFNRFFD